MSYHTAAEITALIYILIIQQTTYYFITAEKISRHWKSDKKYFTTEDQTHTHTK